MNIKEMIRKFITTELNENGNGNHFGDSDSLLESGVLDSFGMMKLLTFIESSFSIQLATQELMPEYFESINAISGLIAAKTA